MGKIRKEIRRNHTYKPYTSSKGSVVSQEVNDNEEPRSKSPPPTKITNYEDRIIDSKNLPQVVYPRDKATALYSNSLKSLVRCPESRPPDKSFYTFNGIEPNHISIENQGRSPLCWIYAGNSVTQIYFNQTYGKGKKFKFSSKYLFFYHLYEQSNKFLNNIRRSYTGRNDLNDSKIVESLSEPLTGGGYSDDYKFLVLKYGLVPESAYPKSHHSERTSEVIKTCTRFLKHVAYDILTSHSANVHEKYHNDALNEIYRILVMFLGEPPSKFSINVGKITVTKITPISFAQKYLPYSFKEFVRVTSDVRKVVGVYQPSDEIKNITLDDIKRDISLNLTHRDVRRYVMKCLDKKIPVRMSCDIMRDYDSNEGYADVNIHRIREYLDLSIEFDRHTLITVNDWASRHSMVLVGYYIKKEDGLEHVIWKILNSWGSKSGNDGYVEVTDEWLELNNYYFYISKKVLSQTHLNMTIFDTPKKVHDNEMFSFGKHIFGSEWNQ